MERNSQYLFEFGPFQLDTAERLLLRNGHRIPLTPKVFETLVALVEHRGRLIEKDKLMKLVWPDSFVEEANLTNNISTLRKALGEGEGDDGAKYIETIPRIGYRFTAQVRELPRFVLELVAERHSLTRIETEETEALPDATLRQVSPVAVAPSRSFTKFRTTAIAVSAVVLTLGGFLTYRFVAVRTPRSGPIKSVAVLPFKNESGNPDLEYLSDGMTESLINGLSGLSNLSVKASSSVARYKGKETEPQKLANELSVQAILSGRLVRRGDTLTLYLSLVDDNSNQIWGRQYDRKLNELLTLQGEVARDVSHQLRARLSGGEDRKVAKNYTENVEAYQLYLRGRYHSLKRTLPEREKAIAYFQQAITLDPSYALAYVGLADAHLSALAADLPPSEFLPQARAAAQTAIEIDDTLAAAHAQLGFVIFWYDWDWKGSEKEIKRALELNPDAADAHLYYAHVLSNTGRHIEALAESKRAREIDPLNLRNSALEGQFLIHAGRADEALTRLQETLDMDPKYFLAYLYRSSAYIEKGMYTEAVTEARKASEVSGNRSTYAAGFLAYALAKSGKTIEARSILEGLLKSSAEKYVPPYTIALVYNGLGEHQAALSWLERAYSQRSAAMVFLKVEPKWNNLRSDLRFQDLLRRVRLTP